MVVEGGHTFHLHRISDRSQLRVVKTNRAGYRIGPELDPSGHFVYVRSDPSKIELWDLDRGEVPAAWPSDVCDVAYRPDGGQIAALRPDGEVRVLRPASHERGPAMSAWVEISGPCRVLETGAVPRWAFSGGDARRDAGCVGL